MTRLQQRVRKAFRRGQTGQSIIILAMGFVALLGFVGIVTDISLLFVRYSSLSRAVDAAAVAAAGQMRRVLDSEDTRGSGTTADDIPIDGEAASNASLSLAARSYIEAYGISPETVLVETCRVQRFRRDLVVSDNGTPADPTDDVYERSVPVDRTGERLYTGTPPVDNPAANAEDRDLYEELCTQEELKLVRVTGQIQAPTTFMRLLGYGEVTLTVSAISQTAVLDVVLVLDVSESMLTQTEYSDYENDCDEIPSGQDCPDMGWRDGSGNRIGYGVRYLPLRHDYIRAIAGGYEAGLPNQDGLPYPQMGTPIVEAWDWAEITKRSQSAILANGRTGYPTLGTETADAYLYQAYTWVPDGGAAGAAPQFPQVAPPNPLCGVRIWPGSAYNRATMPAWLRREMVGDTSTDPAPFTDLAAFQAAFFTTADLTSGNVFYNGFVPQYNYYGCCNDPNGDGNFADLVCQPFRQARDAANGFLERLDFLRGDRVAFVVFDRNASLIDPDGAGSQTAMMETQNDLYDGATLLRRGAQEVLNSVIGVRAESAFYSDTDNDGDWDALLSNESPRTTSYFNDTALADIVDQPTFNACPLDTIEMTSQYGPAGAYYRWDNASTSLIVRSQNSADRDTVLDDVTTRGDRLGQMPSWVFSLSPATWGAQSINAPGFTRQRDYSYEYRASCAGTNIGGALGQGNYALFLNGRREGSVWLMVMLSDGAAGASNKVSRLNGGTTAFEVADPQLFTTNLRTGFYNNPYNATDPLNGTTLSNIPVIEPAVPANGTYGAYGLCPYGTSSDPGEILLNRSFPYCSDLQPETRTYCGRADVATDPSVTIVDNPDNPNCQYFYDVDDYARDWADWIGLTNLQGKVNGGADQLVPTIFTIGFGLNFGYDVETGLPIPPCTDTDYDCLRGISATYPNANYIPDYLGEELLRYIADVGDNNRIDWDYWQYQMGSRIRNGISGTQTQYGPRGTCELAEGDLPPVANARQLYLPLPPRESCGNYYVAASEQDLNRVFNEIASRMFTRLSQ